MKSTFSSEFKLAAKQAPRLFFAPLLGAINAVRREIHRAQSDESPGEQLTSKATTH